MIRLPIILSCILFAAAAALGFGLLGGATLSVLLALIASGLALYMLALASS